PDITGWSGYTTTTDLSTYLNTNKLGLATSGLPGKVMFNGPYLGAVDTDPWGNAYVVAAKNLVNASADRGFVISGGPNGKLDMSPAVGTTTFSVGSTDDIAVA